jgi:hypothetical protein
MPCNCYAVHVSELLHSVINNGFRNTREFWRSVLFIYSSRNVSLDVPVAKDPQKHFKYSNLWFSVYLNHQWYIIYEGILNVEVQEL